MMLPSGKMLAVCRKPGAFVVNLGEALQLMTGELLTCDTPTWQLPHADEYARISELIYRAYCHHLPQATILWLLLIL